MADTGFTVMDFAERWRGECPDKIWLRDRKGDQFTDWSWQAAWEEFQPVAAWLESQYGDKGSCIGILSRNRAHWTLADMAILASGNVSIPLFTTQNAETTEYIIQFADVKLLIVGEAENWDRIKEILPVGIELLALPGVDLGDTAFQWQDIVVEHAGAVVRHRCRHDELFTIPFTSGTTGLPKGVMQTHDSMIIPMQRGSRFFKMRENPRFLSYLPLSHIAERQLVWIQSLINCGEVTFNEALPLLVRDMADVKPTYFFGAPRVWEQIRQGVLAKFGSQEALDKSLVEDRQGTQALVQAALGFTDYDYLLTAAAPTPASLIHWYDSLGITLLEGYGQTEAMTLIVNTPEQRRIGSVGVAVAGVDVKIAEDGELLCRADGLSPGYYKQPEKTAETFVDGWVRTGDKARVDDDGFYYITGRVKDYFKTLQGKFVSPLPLEDAMAASPLVEQQCLLGRGYSKTVMVCVLTERAREIDRNEVEAALLEQVRQVNAEVEKHARMGAVIIADEPWTIDNGLLTPTLKLKRDEVETRFGERAEPLARQAAEQGELLVEWVGENS